MTCALRGVQTPARHCMAHTHIHHGAYAALISPCMLVVLAMAALIFDTLCAEIMSDRQYHIVTLRDLLYSVLLMQQPCLYCDDIYFQHSTTAHQSYLYHWATLSCINLFLIALFLPRLCGPTRVNECLVHSGVITHTKWFKGNNIVVCYQTCQ